MDDKPLGTKGDQVLRRQAAIVAEFERFGYAGRDVLGSEYRCEGEELARQFRFQARIPGAIDCGSRLILMARER